MVQSTASHTIAQAAIKNGLVAANGYTMNVAPGIYKVASASPDTTVLFIVSLLALLANAAVFVYMIAHIAKTKRNPYTSELYTDLVAHSKIKSLAE